MYVRTVYICKYYINFMGSEDIILIIVKSSWTMLMF